MLTGLELIAKERQKQILKHGFTTKGDVSKYEDGQLMGLVWFMLMEANDAEREEVERLLVEEHGFSEEFLYKLDSKSDKEKLTVIGALIAAEIDRGQATGEY